VNAPKDATVFVGQAAIFSVIARAYPAASYQWTSNGVDISGATGSQLTVPNVPLSLSGTIYAVRVQNEAGSVTGSARLTVMARPDLRFTEVMPLPSDPDEEEEDNLHFDWFEVTNFDSNAVNLLGWRFSDEPSFVRAVTITNTIWVRPGESIVFAERLDGAMFTRWWGIGCVPAGLQVYSYSGFGLGSFGETLFLWNPVATSPYDYLATVSWAGATPGVSFEAHQVCEDGACVDEARILSVPGVRGAFRAAEGGHVGSPGYIANPAVRVLGISRSGSNEVRVESRAAPGKSYRLRRATSANMAGAVPLSIQTATNNVITLFDTGADGAAFFYSVEELP
jgi:hypothetical protein